MLEGETVAVVDIGSKNIFAAIAVGGDPKVQKIGKVEKVHSVADKRPV